MASFMVDVVPVTDPSVKTIVIDANSRFEVYDKCRVLGLSPKSIPEEVPAVNIEIHEHYSIERTADDIKYYFYGEC